MPLLTCTVPPVIPACLANQWLFASGGYVWRKFGGLTATTLDLKDLTPAETAMRLDSGLTLPDLFLQKVDVATMAFSLEARCPMTDYRLVEWAMRSRIFRSRSGR